MAKSVNVVSGYFAALHEGHKEYIVDAAQDCDKLIIVVQDDKRQREKYGMNFVPSYSIVMAITVWWHFDLKMENKPEMNIIINHNENVANTLKAIRNSNRKSQIVFVKDGDRNYDSLPQEEKDIMIEKNIAFKYLGNSKIASSSEILND